MQELKKKATDEQLKLWLKYMNLFKDDDVSIDSIKRERYKKIIFEERKLRGKAVKYGKIH